MPLFSSDDRNSTSTRDNLGGTRQVRISVTTKRNIDNTVLLREAVINGNMLHENVAPVGGLALIGGTARGGNVRGSTYAERAPMVGCLRDERSVYASSYARCATAVLKLGRCEGEGDERRDEN